MTAVMERPDLLKITGFENGKDLLVFPDTGKVSPLYQMQGAPCGTVGTCTVACLFSRRHGEISPQLRW